MQLPDEGFKGQRAWAGGGGGGGGGGLAAEWRLCLLPMLGATGPNNTDGNSYVHLQNKVENHYCLICQPDLYGVTCSLFSPCISKLVSPHESTACCCGSFNYLLPPSLPPPSPPGLLSSYTHQQLRNVLLRRAGRTSRASQRNSQNNQLIVRLLLNTCLFVPPVAARRMEARIFGPSIPREAAQQQPASRSTAPRRRPKVWKSLTDAQKKTLAMFRACRDVPTSPKYG